MRITSRESRVESRESQTRLRIRLAGKLTAMSSPGGGETQLLATASALREAGVDAQMWRPWEDGLDDVDVLHLFGSAAEHLPLVEAARRRGVRTALSTIAWFDLASLWREPRPLFRRLAGCARLLGRAALPRCGGWRRRLYHAADVLLPNSRAEAEQLVRYFGVPRERIRVAPNAADERFADADPEIFIQRFGVSGFVLYAGRIEPRKNQLNFLRAMRGTNAPLVFIGDPVPGREKYYRQCRRIARQDFGGPVKFVGRIAHDDPLLASAYAACGCLALASWFETPGLVALEAAMTGAPVVLTERGCTREYFGDHATYVSPANLAQIREKTLAALTRPRSDALAQFVRRNFSWQAAAEATLSALGSFEVVGGRI